jgi:hypothetical protein
MAIKKQNEDSVGEVRFHEKPGAHAAAVSAAQAYLKTTLASGAPKPVVEYAKGRVAAATAGKPAKGKSKGKPAPAPAPVSLSVNEADLMGLIASATEKLGALKAQGYIAANKLQAQQAIDACKAGISSCDASILKFDQLIESALEKLDQAIEAPPAVGLWGVPQTADQTGRVQGLAIEFAAMRQARWRQVQSKTTLEARLADLERIQAR